MVTETLQNQQGNFWNKLLGAHRNRGFELLFNTDTNRFRLNYNGNLVCYFNKHITVVELHRYCDEYLERRGQN